MVKPKTAAITPPDVLDRLLAAAGEDVVLVGGQALGFWLQRYDLALPKGVMAISVATDFLSRSAGDREAVNRFARVLRGEPLFPSRRALTALIGMAVLDISESGFVSVDVIHKVIGLSSEAVRARAVKVEEPSGSYLVMHPLHVLKSRLANLYELEEKRDDKGRMQLAMAIDVAREFVRAQAAAASSRQLATGRSPIQGHVSEIETMAVQDAGRKVAKRHGLHVADAIDPSLIPAGPFWAKRWPALRLLMSTDYAASFTEPKEPAPLSEPAALAKKRSKPT